MLRKINEGEVESDTGFFIHITGRECMKYQQDKDFINISVAYDRPTDKIYIYLSNSKHWDQPHGRIITKNEKNIIENNIKQAVKLLNGNFEVV